jgi:hypothetical protein
LRRLAVTRVVVLLVDETSLQERLKVMAVSLAYRGRAIPPAWPMGQVAVIATLLQWGAAGIPPGCSGLVQADRGLGTSPTCCSPLQRGPYEEPWLSLINWHDDTALVLDDHRIAVAFRTELADS